MLIRPTWKVSVFGVFLVRIFPHSGWIWRDTEYLSVFSSNAGKYGPENLRIWDFLRGVLFESVLPSENSCNWYERKSHWKKATIFLKLLFNIADTDINFCVLGMNKCSIAFNPKAAGFVITRSWGFQLKAFKRSMRNVIVNQLLRKLLHEM